MLAAMQTQTEAIVSDGSMYSGAGTETPSDKHGHQAKKDEQRCRVHKGHGRPGERERVAGGSLVGCVSFRYRRRRGV